MNTITKIQTKIMTGENFQHESVKTFNKKVFMYINRVTLSYNIYVQTKTNISSVLRVSIVSESKPCPAVG